MCGVAVVYVPSGAWHPSRTGTAASRAIRRRAELGYQLMFHRYLAGAQPERVLGRVPAG